MSIGLVNGDLKMTLNYIHNNRTHVVHVHRGVVVLLFPNNINDVDKRIFATR